MMPHCSHTFVVPRRGPDLPAVFAALGFADAGQLYHRFQPQGESCARFAGGRMAVIHTWPEHGLATIDLYGAALQWERLQALGWALTSAAPVSK